MYLDDDIHNYYEKLVVDRIQAKGIDQDHDTDFLADLCCMVLNKLPPRYIRYEVDMAFFLPPEKRLEMQDEVDTAIDASLAKMTS